MRASKGLIVAALALAAFHAVGARYFQHYTLDLGSLFLPTPRYLTMAELWLAFGGVASVALALTLATLRPQGWIRSTVAAVATSRWLPVVGCGCALTIPLWLRLFWLQHAPLTDDEGAYRFAAELLASGRLKVASPPLKEFFDQNFMINDGHLYPAYFLGWPSLMALGSWLRIPAAMVNPILSALTLIPLMRLTARLAGREWVPFTVLLFLTSPFLQIAAATQLSHTACFMALSWSLWAYFSTSDAGAPPLSDVFLGFFSALAFCIRPQAAAPLLVPIFVLWIKNVRRRPDAYRAILLMLTPVALLAGCFLTALWIQNGSPLVTGYARYGQYLFENGFRFTIFSPADVTTISGFVVSDMSVFLAKALGGFTRLNFDLWGWPCSFLLLPWAARKRSAETRLLWWMLALFFGVLVLQRDWGIDTFGPLHSFEAALPLSLLTIVGAARMGQSNLVMTRERMGPEPKVLAKSFMVALMVTASLGFSVVRVRAVGQIADHINTALRAPSAAGLHHAVVFSPLPFAPRCGGTPNHFVFFRPTNDADLQNDVLWVNDLGTDQNRRFLGSHPSRTGFVLVWNSACRVELRPIAAQAPVTGSVPIASDGRARRPHI